MTVEIRIKDRTNVDGEYEVYTTGLHNGLKYTVKKEGKLYIILNNLGDAYEEKENEEEARAFAYKRALGFLDMFKKNYKGEEKLEIVDEIQLRKEKEARKDSLDLAGLLKASGIL